MKFSDRAINVRFSKRHIMSVMDKVLKETYNDKPRYSLRPGVKPEDILKLEIRPIITHKEKSVIVQVSYLYPWTAKRQTLDRKVEIHLEPERYGFCYLCYDYDNRKPVYWSYKEAIDYFIYRVCTLDRVVKDTTAIPIYLNF